MSSLKGTIYAAVRPSLRPAAEPCQRAVNQCSPRGSARRSTGGQSPGPTQPPLKFSSTYPKVSIVEDESSAGCISFSHGRTANEIPLWRVAVLSFLVRLIKTEAPVTQHEFQFLKWDMSTSSTGGRFASFHFCWYTAPRNVGLLSK